MTVSVQGLRNAADYMRQITGVDTSWLLRAADEIERLRRRVVVLEKVIAEEMHPADCHDEANAMIVEEIYRRPKSSETQGQQT